jgi:hypothetical protein
LFGFLGAVAAVGVIVFLSARSADDEQKATEETNYDEHVTRGDDESALGQERLREQR